MKKLACAFALLAVCGWAMNAQADTVKLTLDGVHCNGCGNTIAGAMGKVPSAKVTVKPTKDAPMAEVEIDAAKGDVGDLAKAAAEAKTPHVANGAPSATLVLSAEFKEDNAKKLAEALDKVKGVTAKASKADAKAGTVSIKLDDKGGAKLADIKKALTDAGFKVK